MQIGHSLRNRKIGNDEKDCLTKQNARNHLKESVKNETTILSKCVRLVVLFAIFLLSLTLALIYSIDEWQTYSYKLPVPPKLEGILKPNTELGRAIRIAEGKLVGPESLEIYNGILYTGTADGKIVAIENEDTIRTVATFHKKPSIQCGQYETEHLCGRPLGLRFDKMGFLYVVEAYSGLYRLNVTTGERVHLMRSDDKVLGRPMKFVNDLDVTDDGFVYFSDTSSNYERRDFPYLVLEGDRSGRIFRFDTATNSVSTIQENIGWANGIQVSADGDFLLYSEGQFARVMKLYLKGPQEGKIEVFYDNLPGFPDNIRITQNNSFWIALGGSRKHSFSFYDFITDKPWLRTLILKVFHPMSVIKSFSSNSLIMEVDINGAVVRTLQDNEGSLLNCCSEVLLTDAALFLGSFQADFIGKFYL